MKYLLAFQFALLFVSASSLAQTGEWVKVETPDYSIEFPSEPIAEIQNAPSAIGDLVMDIRVYEVVEVEKDENFSYSIISTMFPAGTVHSDDKAALPKIFEGGVNGAVENAHGKLLSNQEIEIDGYPGREFRIEYQEGLAVSKTRSYLVKDKMFILQTICDPKKVGNPAAERFLGSFRLKN